MVYLPTCTIQIKQMWVNIPYMDPMGWKLLEKKSGSSSNGLSEVNEGTYTQEIAMALCREVSGEFWDILGNF